MSRDEQMVTKRCCSCKQELPVSEFNRSSRTIYQGYCRPCARRRQRDRDMQKKYGITMDDYQEMLADQEGKCACCGGEPGKRALAVDHDHKTGQVRDLLCDPCNVMLGMANDDQERLKAGMRYLRRWEKTLINAQRRATGY